MCYYSSCWIDLIGIISSTITAFIYAFFFSKIFPPKKKSKYYMGKYFVFIYGMYLICRIIPAMFELVGLYMFIAFSISLLLFAQGKWYKKILFAFSTHLFTLLCELPLNELLFMKYGYSSEAIYNMIDTDYYAALDIIYSHISSYALTGITNICGTLYFSTILMFSDKKNKHFDVWLICVVIAGLFIANSLFLFYFVDNNYAVVMMVVGPILSVILIVYTISKLTIYRKYDESLEENKFLKEKEKMQLSYYEMLENREKVVRSINHDIKNNLQVMYSLDDYKKRRDMIEIINSNLDKHYLKKYTSHNILNIVLNIKVNEAIKKNIDIDVLVRRKLDFMEDMEVSNLITNILDNAIVATEKTNEKRINFIIRRKTNYILIECENTLNEEIGKQLVSTKSWDHGDEMKIIKNIVQKYNGEVNYAVDDNMFKIIIMIKMTEN